MFNSLRLRLTTWYLAFFSVLFVLFALLLHGVLSRSLERRLDSTLASKASTAAALMREEMDEMHGDPVDASRGVLAELQPGSSALAILENGEVLATSDRSREKELRAAGGLTEGVFPLQDWGGYGAHAAVRRISVDGHSFVIVMAESLESIAQDLRVLRQILWFATLPVLMLAGFGGYLLTRRSLAPLSTMVEQTRAITGQTLDRRLAVGNATAELATLATTFNELLARLDQSFEGMQRFVQDASHELRTPLAVIRGEAEVALSRERSVEEYRESLTVIHQESRRLSRLVDDLLNLARADAGHVQLRVEELYLNDLLAECCGSLQTLAATRQVEVECRCDQDVAFRGDEELLRRMVINLVDNAVRYTPPGGRVSVALEAQGPDIRIRVADSGVGIEAEARQRVFERFYRADKARSRQQGGFGLGLSIVKWIAESHDGEVEVTSEVGAGSTFTVHLARQ